MICSELASSSKRPIHSIATRLINKALGAKILYATLAIAVVVAILPHPAYADPTGKECRLPSGNIGRTNGSGECVSSDGSERGSAGSTASNQCSGGGQTVEIGTPGLSELCANGNSTNPILSMVAGFANYLVAIIGAVGVLMIVISGIQMITSTGQPEAIKAAKKRLTTTIVALVVLVAMKVILNLVVAGSPF